MNKYTIYVLATALVSATLVYLMTDRIFGLFDWTYHVEPAYRVLTGQLPYRDFFLVLTPGVIFLFAGLLALGGGNIPLVVFAMLAQIVIMLLSYDALRKIVRNEKIAFFLVLPVAGAVHVMQPYPSYEPSALLFILASFVLLLRALEHKDKWSLWFFAGFFAAIAPLFKQNTGGVYLLSFFGVLLLARFLADDRPSWKAIILSGVGAGIVVVGFFLWLVSIDALGNFIYQTYTFPGEVRSPLKSVPALIKMYLAPHALVIYTVLFGTIAAFALKPLKKYRPFASRAAILFAFVVVPLFVGVALFVVDKHVAYNLRSYILPASVAFMFAALAFVLADVYRRLKHDRPLVVLDLVPLAPFLILYASHLSQGPLGTSFFIEMPIIVFLLAAVYRKIEPEKIESFSVNDLQSATKIFGVVFALYVAFFSWSVIRWAYFYDDPRPVRGSEHPKLNIVATKGPYLPRIDALVAYLDNHVPREDPIVQLPYEDPIFYLTERKPPVFFSSLDLYMPIGGSFPDALADGELFNGEIKWFIVKRDLQDDFTMNPNYERVIGKAIDRSELVDTMPGYAIYRNLRYEE